MQVGAVCAAARRRSPLCSWSCNQVTPRLEDVEQRAMIVIGGRDPVLPSKEVGTKLVKEMQRAFVKVGVHRGWRKGVGRGGIMFAVCPRLWWPPCRWVLAGQAMDVGDCNACLGRLL